MDVFVSQGIWNQSELAVLNRVRRYKKAFHRSDAIACDGRSVRPDMLTDHPGTSTWIFAREQPNKKDLDLWITALASISSPNFTLQTAAGRLLRVPANHGGWYIDEDGSTIVRQSPDESRVTFQPTGGRSTRQRLYHQDESPSTSLNVSDLQLATISPVDNDSNQVRLQSRCLQPQPRQDQHGETLLDALRNLPNPGLWDNAECDGDGWWIEESLNNGDLVVVSDGSYKSEKATDVCSCAFRLLCKRRKLKFQCTWAERLPEAGIYRGEILGALGYLIVLRVVTKRESFTARPRPVVKGIADNTGVIRRARNPNAPLTMNQSQADVLRLMTFIITDLPICIAYTHVHSHLDDHISYELLPFNYQQNADMDAKAQSALDKAIESRNFIASQFPYEPFTISCPEKRITKNFTTSIYIEHGRMTAQNVFSSKGLLTPDQFKEVYWGAIHHLITKVYPPTFRVWYTKHIFECNGAMRYLHRNEPQVYPSPACPCCGHPDENASHIILCPDQGRTNLYNDSVTDLVRWMRKEKTHPTIVLLVRRYLAARGTQSMLQIWISCGGRRDANQTGFQLAVAHNLLGWKNFVDGRIHKTYVEIQEDYIVSRPSNQQRSRKSSAKWASGFVDMIIRITHRQGLYRNEKLHYKQHFGAESPREYQQIMARIQNLHNHTDPDDLLPADQYLLEENLADVASWNATRRQIWTAEFEASLAARRSRMLKRKRRYERLGLDPLNHDGRRKKRRKKGKKSRRDKPRETSRSRDLASSLVGTTAEGSHRHKRRKKKRREE